MGPRPKIEHRTDNSRLEENVLWFQIAVYQPRLLEHRQCIQQLGGENFHELCTQPLELILLDQFIKVGGQKLEHQAQVATVDE